MAAIITIGREFGSGGREFARLLSERLGIPAHDRSVIAEIAQRTSFAEEYVRGIVERTPQRPVLPFLPGGQGVFFDGHAEMPAESVYRAQREAVLFLADHAPCIIVGRCADYILRDRAPLRLFLYADLEDRVRRCLSRAPAGERHTEREMRQIIQRMDRERAKYYEFFTGATWGDRHRYDLCLNTSGRPIPELVAMTAALLGAPSDPPGQTP